MAIVKNMWLKKLSKNSRMAGEELIKPGDHSENPNPGQGMDMQKLTEALDAMHGRALAAMKLLLGKEKYGLGPQTKLALASSNWLKR